MHVRLPTPLELLRLRKLRLVDRLRLSWFALRCEAGWSDSWRFGDRKVYFARSELYIDLRVFAEVFLMEDYRANYEGAVVVDVGGHKGYFGAYALLRGAKSVITYEPAEANFSLLEETAATFRDADHAWELHKAAVGAEEREAKLQLATESWSHSLLVSDEAQPFERVPVVSMTHILGDASRLGGSVIVKIDVEGAECEIVQGTSPEAWAGVDEVFVETHSFAPCGREDLSSRLVLASLVEEEAAGGIMRARRHRD
jgi:FkbM family methyltransferase